MLLLFLTWACPWAAEEEEEEVCSKQVMNEECLLTNNE
jgi:hypothetical protein